MGFVLKQLKENEICNVCYKCRVFVTISDDPIVKQRILIFSRLHGDHPHGLNPSINLSRYNCIDSNIDLMIKK